MRLVVIGGVAAGLSAAARARRIDKNLEIVVLEKGDTISYAACGLPYYLDGRVRSLDELVVYTPEYFSRRRNIAVRTGACVASIAHPRREVVLAAGERIPYDKLVVATGACPDRAGIAGTDQPHVFALQTLEDARRMKVFLETRHPQRAAVIGAGYIGLEMAEVLRANGLHVTLFQADGSLLGRTDGTLSKALLAQFARFGVEFRPHEPVRAIGTDKVNGTHAEIVIITAGFKPNVELAADAGVEIGRTGAIHVNERMETNLSGIYAAGDCVEATHLVTGRATYVPLGTSANKMGRVAGANAAGRRERFPGIAGTSIVRVCGLGVGMTGLSCSQARAEGFDAVSTAIEALDRPRYFRGKPTTVELVAERRTGRVLGGLVLGEEGVAGRVNVVTAALHAGMRVEDLEQLDLAYAPPYASVWDPLLIAAQQLIKLLD